LTRGNEGIRIDKSASSGIIISGLEVVEAGFGVVDIAPVAEGVMGTEGGGMRAGSGQDLAPGVVGVPDDHSARGVEKGSYITLCVGHIVVDRAVVEAERLALLLYSI